MGSVRAAVDAIRRGSERSIDLGSARWGSTAVIRRRAGGAGTFLVACGMGLDARIMAAAQHEWKRRMLFGAYVGAAIGELTRLRTAVFRITADGQELEISGYLVLIANAGEIVPGRIGPRRPIDPGRRPPAADGPRGGPPARRTARGGLPAAQPGRARRHGSSAGPCSEVRVEAEPAQPIEIDGDDQPPGWLEARVLPGA